MIRIELEQQTYADSNTYTAHVPATDCPERISGLQALLEGAPPLPDRRLLWHRAFEELLDGTRDGSKHPWAMRSETNSKAELQARIGEVERLKDQVQTMGMSIANAVSDRSLFLIHNTNPSPSGNVYS